MKKVFGLLLASSLVLGACGSDEGNKKDSKTESVNENKTQFKNDTLVIDDAVLKIKDTFIVNNENSDGKELAFTYEVKNKTDKEEVTPSNVWMATMAAQQESENTVNDLEVGLTPTTGKYEEWSVHLDDTIKKGKTAKGIMTYSLQNDNDVTLKATKGIDGKKLGTKKIKLNDLKTKEYSAADDINGDTSNGNEVSNKDSSNQNEANKESVNDSKSQDNLATASTETTENNKGSKEGANNAQLDNNQASGSIDSNSNNQQVNQSQKAVINNDDSNNQMSESEIAEWNKTKPTTHDESQMEGVGGHPSAFDSSIPKETQGVPKVDDNGEEYIDATGE